MFLPFLVYTIGWFFQAFTGFGAGIFIVGILSLIYDPKEVIISSTVVNFIGIIFMFLFLKKFPALSLLYPLMLGSFLGIAISSKFLILMNREILKVLIGLFIISIGVYDYLVQSNRLNLSLKPSLFNGFFAGFLSGIFAGLIGMGGPPPVVYLNQVCSDIERFKATLTFFFGTNVLMRLFFYTFYGSNHWNAELIIPAFLSVPLGVFSGYLLSRRVSASFLKRFIALSIFFLGLLLTFSSFEKSLGFPSKH